MNGPEGRKRIKKRAQGQPERWSDPEPHLRGDDQAGQGGISGYARDARSNAHFLTYTEPNWV